MKDHYEVKVFVENDVGELVEKTISIPRKFDVDIDDEIEKKETVMLYYVKLDKNKEYLEVKEARNIHQLSKILKLGFNTIKNYLDGQSEILDCGVRIPLISFRDKKMYLISEYKEWIEMKNFKYMSKRVIDDLNFRNSFRDGFEGVYAKGKYNDWK